MHNILRAISFIVGIVLGLVPCATPAFAVDNADLLRLFLGKQVDINLQAGGKVEHFIVTCVGRSFVTLGPDPGSENTNEYYVRLTAVSAVTRYDSAKTSPSTTGPCAVDSVAKALQTVQQPFRLTLVSGRFFDRIHSSDVKLSAGLVTVRDTSEGAPNSPYHGAKAVSFTADAIASIEGEKPPK